MGNVHGCNDECGDIHGLELDYDGINGEPTEFEWNIFPGFTTLQLCGKVNDLLSDLGQTPETFTGRILFMLMFYDISCDRKCDKEECLANVGVVKVLARRFGIGQWSFIGPGSEKKRYSAENSPQGAWDHIADEMLLELAESGHPIFRATTPLTRVSSKARDMENCQYTSLQIIQQLKQFFASSFLSISSVSTEQWRIYVKNLKFIKIDQGKMMYSWVNQLFSVKLRQKLFCRMKTIPIIKFYGNRTWNESNRFHQKTK